MRIAISHQQERVSLVSDVAALACSSLKMQGAMEKPTINYETLLRISKAISTIQDKEKVSNGEVKDSCSEIFDNS
jgi:hypothetical protein